MTAKVIVYMYADDFEGMRSWWEDALGQTPGVDTTSWAAFDLDGGSLAVHRHRPDHPAEPPPYHLSVEVSDLDAAYRRMTEAGAQVVRGIADESFGRAAILADPEGREFRLVEVEEGMGR